MATGVVVTQVGDLLAQLRGRAGLSRRDLAELARISDGTIKLIEYGATEQPSPDTLRRIADGLATNRATARVDADSAAELYGELMAAAGYAVTATPPYGGLEGEIGQLVRSKDRAAALAAFVRKYPNLSPDERRLVDALIDHLGE